MRALITQSLLAFLGCVNYRFAAHTASRAHCSAYYSLQQIGACHSETAAQPGLSDAGADPRPARILLKGIVHKLGDLMRLGFTSSVGGAVFQ